MKMTTKKRYYTTRAKYENHPITLILKEFGSLKLNEIWKVLGNDKSEDQIVKERKKWLNSKIKDLGLDNKAIRAYKDRSNLHRDISKIVAIGMIKNEVRGVYCYCSLKTQEELVFEEYFIARKIKPGTTNKKFGGYIEPKIKIQSDNHDEERKSFVNLFTYRDQSLEGVISLMYLIDKEKSEVGNWFEKYAPRLIKDLSNNLRLTILRKAKEIINQDTESKGADKKELKEILDNGRYNYFLYEDGWHMTIPGGSDEVRELAGRVIAQLETPMVIAVLPPIPHEYKPDEQELT